jgi:stringent starvation protein B
MAWLRNYIFRSTYEWIVDHAMTPYLLVNGLEEGVVVPEYYLEDGQIVLNLSPSAIRDFVMDEKGFSFTASFSGEAISIEVPYPAVVSLYSKESGQGIYTDEEDGHSALFINELDDETYLPEPPTMKEPTSPQKPAISERLAKSGLKVVK